MEKDLRRDQVFVLNEAIRNRYAGSTQTKPVEFFEVDGMTTYVMSLQDPSAFCDECVTRGHSMSLSEVCRRWL